MCGIFGVLTTKDSPLTRASLRTTVDRLFRLSESRGKEAAGISLLSGDTIRVYKEAVPASTLIRRQAYRRLFNDALVDDASTAGDRIGRAVTVIGHSRLVTNGSQACANNNQPVLADGMVAVHNGIIVNEADLWDRYPMLHRRGDVLRKQYGWEGAPDTSTTWRVGDGTAAFYNYIYYTVAGFSEHDTFRSNQIREGRITRDAALARVREENAPRYETIRSYCRTVGLDYERTLEAIRRIPRLYAAPPS